MAYRDLRDWIDHLEKDGELIRIKDEISIEPDAGAIGRAVCDLEGPGVLAENVAGFNTPLAIGLHASWRRAAMAIGLPKTSSHKEQVAAWDSFFKSDQIKAKMVDDAPCKENILKGDKVNLFQFPIPRINIHDGSFYISKPMVITKDPDSDRVNVGMYRMMVLDRNETALGLHTAASHGALHYERYAKRGQDMPMAVALGTEPVLPMVAGSWQPALCCEFDFAGAIRGEPEELVMAETVDLPVPARAEIILEGVLKCNGRTLEAPFGESPGAYSGYFMAQVFEIRAITHRNNPIYDTLFMGRPVAENHYMTAYSKLAGDLNTVFANRPEVTGIAYLPPYAMALVIQGRWGHTGHPREVMLTSKWKVVIAVDEDIDPWDANQVIWAMSTRCRPDIDVLMIPEIPGRLDPAASPHGTMTRMLIDATKSRPPYHRYRPVGFIEPRMETPKWRERILEAWGKGGNK